VARQNDEAGLAQGLIFLRRERIELPQLLPETAALRSARIAFLLEARAAILL
jgi:hypothetical protein